MTCGIKVRPIKHRPKPI